MTVRRLVRTASVAVLALLLIWLVGGYFLFVRPAVDKPQPVDAIVVLGSPIVDGRFATGLSLAQAGYSKNLVISRPQGIWPRSLDRACSTPPPGIAVTCFKPDPSTTRGEAEEIRRLAAQHHWTRVLVVTSTYHVSRARMIIKRCYSGTLLMVPADKGIGLLDWGYQYLYQTGAYVKALADRSC